VTAHPTAEWTLQQLREAIPADYGYRFLIHDRDRIFSQALDRSIGNLGLRVLQTPPHCPQANAICERVLGTLRREALDFVIPLTADHPRRLLHAGYVMITKAVLICPWGLASRSHPCNYPLHFNVNDTGFHRTSASCRARSWVACIMTTDWRNRQRDALHHDV
jgi:hypothetical protein